MKSLYALLILAGSLQASEPPAKDREAILSMAGEFKVTWNFHETLALKNGYEIKPEKYTEDAHELVVVAEDTGRRIRLQHYLVTQGMAIKHWARIWTYEDTRICEFQGHNSWKMRDLTSEEAKGTWSEQVTQVDDSPRYETWGKWTHHGDVHEWSGGDTWRPLPRREHKKRKDYDIVTGGFRYVTNGQGWSHEQDITKTISRDGQQHPLAREWGLNQYVRTTTFDFGVAKSIWEKDRSFWNIVVVAWEEIQQSRPDIKIYDTFDVPKLRSSLEGIQLTQTEELEKKVRASLESFLQTQQAPAQPTAQK